MKKMITSSASSRRRGTQGFTLIELMVSVTIGMILVLFVSSLYFNSKSSYRLNDDNARIQEDGRFALSVIGRSLMQAGYGNIVTSISTDFPPTSEPGLTGITGCDDGFVTPITARKPTCGGTTSTGPAFAVSYTAEPYNNADSPISGAGADCSGTNAGGTVTNSFYLDSGTLYCKGNAGADPQAILSNVDAMTLTYGVDTTGNYTASQSKTKASDVVALTANDNNRQGWDQVVTVTVCLEIHSTNNVTTAKQSYLKCGDTTPTTATDFKLHTTMTREFTLRNNATPSLVS
ncbi:PilW family protein [Paraherbaspirillum soli]|uniref:PilW family protein n=1 Tax=Paraherbaspirillum soli TaxID=631222 RepID=A0ABW0M3A4_9BURK